MSSGQNDWSAFAVGSPSTRANWTEFTCQPLDTVHHVAHLNAARRILEDGCIRAGLVFDKSRLNTERILVSWLSPNYWNRGFRYGNVRFGFEWRALLGGMNPYWVESIAYGVEACRILLSADDESDHLQPYDPSLGDGPWWYDTEGDQHYWNGEHCLEVMIRRNLSLDECTGVDFVTHHEAQCSIDHENCPDRGVSEIKPAAEFLALVVAEDLEVDFLQWTSSGVDGEEEVVESDLRAWFSWMWLKAQRGNNDYGGPVASSDAASVPLARALLGALARRDDETRRRIVQMFQTEDEALLSVAVATAACIGLSDPSILTGNGD